MPELPVGRAPSNQQRVRKDVGGIRIRIPVQAAPEALEHTAGLLRSSPRFRSGWEERLAAVDVVGRARDGCVGHDVDGQRGDVRGSDDTPNRQGRAELVRSSFETRQVTWRSADKARRELGAIFTPLQAKNDPVTGGFADPRTARCEEMVNAYYVARTGSTLTPLDEHAEGGLPSLPR